MRVEKTVPYPSSVELEQWGPAAAQHCFSLLLYIHYINEKCLWRINSSESLFKQWIMTFFKREKRDWDALRAYSSSVKVCRRAWCGQKTGGGINGRCPHRRSSHPLPSRSQFIGFLHSPNIWLPSRYQILVAQKEQSRRQARWLIWITAHSQSL